MESARVPGSKVGFLFITYDWDWLSLSNRTEFGFPRMLFRKLSPWLILVLILVNWEPQGLPTIMNIWQILMVPLSHWLSRIVRIKSGWFIIR